MSYMDDNMQILSFDDPNEKIFRIAKRGKLYWDSNGKVSSSVFDLRINEEGLSFDRANGRDDKACCESLHKRLNGVIISLKVKNVSDIDEIRLDHTPSPNNQFHAELFYLTTNHNTLKQIKHMLADSAYNEPY